MSTYNLKSWILTCLKNNNINKFTPIQEKSLSLMNSGKNFIGVSHTGSGKTLAYLLPILERLDFNINKYQAIIVSPTRELARQVFNVLKLFKEEQPNLKAKLWIGGIDLNQSINNARTNYAHIIICTPQRFLEISNNLPNTLFENVNTFVLDEADMLLDLNFYPQITQISNKLNFDNIYKIAMSATLHNQLNNEINKIYKNTIVTNLNNVDKLMQKIDHIVIKTNDKQHALSVILNTINPYFCLIFTNTKTKANEIYKLLLNQNYNVINLHSGLSTRSRKNNYKDIKNQKFQYVVASDLFSRGMDIEGASHIINYDIPKTPEWYIHRAGRTGRNKYTGISYVLYTNNDQKDFQKILDKKIHFQVKQIKNNELVDSKLNFKNRKIKNDQQEKEIKKILATNSKIVKPGYKKKLRSKINKIKQKHKREHIEKLIKKERIKQYHNKDTVK